MTIYAKYQSNLAIGFREEDLQNFLHSLYKENGPRPLAAMFFEISS